MTLLPGPTKIRIMYSGLRVATMILGALLGLQGVAWLVDPHRAAAGLGMPLLDGIGRSTQIGDLSIFFLAAGGTILVGSRPGRAKILLLPAMLVGGAAVTRTIAWAIHGAAFATLFIVAEVLMSLFLLVAYSKLDTDA